MNKLKLILLSILGGMNVLITVISPILLILVYLAIFGIEGHWTSYAFIILGCGASLFRGIKYWVKEEW